MNDRMIKLFRLKKKTSEIKKTAGVSLINSSNYLGVRLSKQQGFYKADDKSILFYDAKADQWKLAVDNQGNLTGYKAEQFRPIESGESYSVTTPNPNEAAQDEFVAKRREAKPKSQPEGAAAAPTSTYQSSGIEDIDATEFPLVKEGETQEQYIARAKAGGSEQTDEELAAYFNQTNPSAAPTSTYQSSGIEDIDATEFPLVREGENQEQYIARAKEGGSEQADEELAAYFKQTNPSAAPGDNVFYSVKKDESEANYLARSKKEFAGFKTAYPNFIIPTDDQIKDFYRRSIAAPAAASGSSSSRSSGSSSSRSSGSSSSRSSSSSSSQASRAEKIKLTLPVGQSVSDNWGTYTAKTNLSFDWTRKSDGKTGTYSSSNSGWNQSAQKINGYWAAKSGAQSAAPAGTAAAPEPGGATAEKAGKPTLNPIAVANVQAVLYRASTKALAFWTRQNEMGRIREMIGEIKGQVGIGDDDSALNYLAQVVYSRNRSVLDAFIGSEDMSAAIYRAEPKDLKVAKKGQYSKAVSEILKATNRVFEERKSTSQYFLKLKSTATAAGKKEEGKAPEAVDRAGDGSTMGKKSSFDPRIKKLAKLRRLRVRAQMEAAVEPSARFGRSRVS